MDRGAGLKGRRFTAEVIPWAVRWCRMFPVNCRDLELMLLARGVEVDHTTIFRWIQAHVEELEKPVPPASGYAPGDGRDLCPGEGTLDVSLSDGGQPRADDLLAAPHDVSAAKRFFRKRSRKPHTVDPRTLTVDNNLVYPSVVAEMKRDGELWRRSRLLNSNI